MRKELTHQRSRRPNKKKSIVRFRSTVALPLAVALILIAGLAGCAKSISDVGGVRLTFTAACLQTQPTCDLGAKISNVLDILKQRGVDGLQDSDTKVRQDGADRIVVELPG